MDYSPRVSIVGSKVYRDLRPVYKKFLTKLEIEKNRCTLSEPLLPESESNFTQDHEWACFPSIQVQEKRTSNPIELVDIAIRQRENFLHCIVTAHSGIEGFSTTPDAQARTEALKAISIAAFKACEGDLGYNTLNNATHPNSVRDVFSVLSCVDFIMLRRGLTIQEFDPNWEQTLERSIPGDFFVNKAGKEAMIICSNEPTFALRENEHTKMISRAIASVRCPSIPV